MDNKKIAEIFNEIADILEIKGESFFRVNAYRKGALAVSNYPKPLADVLTNSPKDLDKIPGLGKALKSKIEELIKTGKSKAHENYKKGFPPGLLEILKIRTLGPKKVKLFYTELAIKTVDELKAAAEKGLLRDLPKMGEKSEEEILKAIEEFRQFSTDRSLVHEAHTAAISVIEHMQKMKEVDQIQYAGSLRRSQETIGDVDILVTSKNISKDREKIMQHFTTYDEVINVIAEGDTKSSVILSNGIQVDLRLVKNESFGAALHYFTGSKDHNVRLRDIAKKRGMKVNEYGLFEGEKRLAGETEEGMFENLDLPWIPPEMRRNDGEFEYAMQHGKLPELIQLNDIKGDLHNHSTYSDGKNTLEEMTKAFIKQGYEYFAITDHSPLMPVAKGMSPADVKRQWEEIDELNKKYEGKIKILKGSEVDILKDGSLDYEDSILSQLDVVVISAHMHQNLDFDEQTKRIIRAVENPYSMILGHPTGRLINKRPEMKFDMEKVIDACIANNVALEINSQPLRLDLAEKYIRVAKEMGAKFAINTDSHTVDTIGYMQYGVGMARRGWLTKKDIINTQGLSAFDN